MGLFGKKQAQALDQADKKGLTQQIMNSGILGDLRGMTQPQINELVEQGSAYFIASMNPFMSQDNKRKMINELFNKLSEDTFSAFAPVFLNNTNVSDENCHKFGTTKEQVDNFMNRYPRLEPFRFILEEKVIAKRKSVGVVY
jgi:tyrosine-protein phosphatase YwqE